MIETEIRRTIRYEPGFFFTRENGRITSAARIVAETDKFGMIDGATTIPEFRGQSIYPSLSTASREYLFKKGKVALEYILESDETVQNLVKKTGGTYIGEWIILKTKKKLGLKQAIKRNLRHFKRRFYIQDRDS